jgi:hypothetical protein
LASALFCWNQQYTPVTPATELFRVCEALGVALPETLRSRKPACCGCSRPENAHDVPFFPRHTPRATFEMRAHQMAPDTVTGALRASWWPWWTRLWWTIGRGRPATFSHIVHASPLVVHPSAGFGSRAVVSFAADGVETQFLPSTSLATSTRERSLPKAYVRKRTRAAHTRPPSWAATMPAA